MEKAPCLGCKDRQLGCHSKCGKYQRFVELNEKVKKERQKEVIANSAGFRPKINKKTTKNS